MTSPLVSLILGSTIFWSLAARAEYRAPVVPELSKMQAIPAMGRTGAPAAVAPTPAEILAQAKANPALAQALMQQIRANSAPSGSEVPAEPRPAAAKTEAVNPRESALESLRSKKLLEQELARVRQALEASNPVPVEPAPVAEAPAVETIPNPDPVVQPESINRLLSSVQSRDKAREQLAARVQLVKENLARTKDKQAGRLSNSAGGTLFQASLEFNRSARGSTPSQRGRSKQMLTQRRRLEKDLADAEGIASGKPVDLLAKPAAKGRLLAFSPGAQPIQMDEVPESLLVRHKPSYSDSAIHEAGAPGAPAAPAGAGGPAAGGAAPVPDASGALRHKSTYAGSAIDAGYDGGGASR